MPTMPPFMQQGRKDLYDTIQQSGLKREEDNGIDKWIGHAKINPIEVRGCVSLCSGFMQRFCNLPGKFAIRRKSKRKFAQGDGSMHGMPYDKS